MKTQSITHTFYLILVFSCASVQAETMSRTKTDTVYTARFGIVNAVYTNESRMVISDISLLYKYETNFYNIDGNRISDISNKLKSGTPVKYYYYQKPPYLILKDLKIITMHEFNESKKVIGNY